MLLKFKLVVCVVAVFMIFNTCKKKPFDYRNKFLGTYNCKVIDTGMHNGKSLVYYYDDVMVIEYGIENHNIVISNWSTLLEYELTKDGKFGRNINRPDGRFYDCNKVEFISFSKYSQGWRKVIRNGVKQ